MNEIIIICSKIQNTRFPCLIDDVKYDSLTDFVHQITRNARMPFSANLTDLTDRKSLIYTCTFARCGCPSKLVFTHTLDFYENEIFNFDIQNSNLQHINHPLNNHFVECHRNCNTQSICDEIRHQTHLGVLPGRIRTNLDIQSGSQIYYNIRRSIVQEQLKEDLDNLIMTLKNGSQKSVMVKKNNGVLNSLTIIDNEILRSDYSSDIAIIDDTCMTNMYGLPVEGVIVVDQESHTQLLGYSVIPNKSTESFINFFNDYIDLGGKPFRIIVIDRLESQYDAIVQIFPNTYIMFCLVHIRRDLLIYFKCDDEIILKFDRAKKFPETSFEYLDYLKFRRSKMKDTDKGKRCLDLLISRNEHWLPIYMIRNGMYLNFDTSRIEGLFGIFKGNYGHDRGKISTAVKNFNNLCSVLKSQSYSDYWRTYQDFSQFPLFSAKDIPKCGKMILQFMKIELDAFLLHNLDRPCVWCSLRSSKSPFTLPCRHIFVPGSIIDISKIHQRFLRSDDIFTQLPNVVIVKDADISQAKSRNNLLARLDPFINLYGKNKEIDSIFDKTITNLEDLRVEKNPGMPLTLAQAGRTFSHPANNVIGGRQKTKRKYTCSYCGSSKHIKTNCPLLHH